MNKSRIKSLCLAIANLCLIGLLGLLLTCIACLYFYREIPLPDPLTKQLLLQLSPEGSTLSAEQICITPRGKLALYGLQLRANEIAEPLIEAESATVHLRFFSATASLLDHVVIAGGTLYMPASVAPDGQHSPILQKVAFALKLESDQMHISSFAAKQNEISIRGSATFPHKKTRADEALSEAVPLLESIPYELIRTVLSEVDQHTFLYKPTIAFYLDVDSSQSISLKTKLSSRRLQHPKLEGKNFRLETDLTYAKKTLVADSPALLHIDQFAYPEQNFMAQTISAYVAKENWKDLIQKKWPIFEFSAEKLQWKTHELAFPYIRITSNQLPQLSFQGNASLYEQIFAFAGEFDFRELSGRLSAKGPVDLLAAIPSNQTRSLPQISYASPPHISAQAVFDAQLSLKEAQVDLISNGLTLNGVSFDQIEAAIHYDGTSYQISESLIQRDTQWVRLGFSLNSQTNAYALSLVGSAVPYQYNAFLPNWWSVIFQDFEFAETSNNLGDFIIYGHTDQKVADLFFGHVYATDIRYRDVPVDEGTLFVRGREHYVEVDRMDLSNTYGQLKGKLAFTSLDDAIGAPVSIRYQMKGAILPAHAANIFGGTVADILSDFEMNTAATVTLDGAQFNEAYPALSDKSYFQLSASTQQRFSYRTAKLDRLSLELKTAQGQSYLRNLQFGFANGSGSGQADIITTPNLPSRLNFDLQLVNANKDLTFTDLPILKVSTEPTSSGDVRYDLQLRAIGPIDQVGAFQGYGSLKLRDKDLAAIQLFGPLSKLLQNTRLGFTSLSLQTLDAVFDIRGQTIAFQRMSINGPQTRIQAVGTLKFPEQSLNMDVSINLIANMVGEETGLGKVGKVLNPIFRPLPNLLSFTLTGTLQDQIWRSRFDPRNIFK